jgi:cation:H+ antiporter
MPLNLLLLALGLLLIIKGGDLFVSASVRIAERLRMPRVVIGSTLVSLATTTPELTVSILSGLKGEPGLAVGNAVGSCICNLGLILGVLAALKQVDANPRVLRTAFATMLGCGLLLCGLTLGLKLSRSDGALLVALGAAYFAFDFRRHQREASAAAQAEAIELETEILTRHPRLQGGWGAALQFLAGAALVVVGSKLLVEAAVKIATTLGVPSILLGLTVVAVGTSLPELITAVTSSRRNVSDLSLGNVLGANIANLTFVVGSAALVQEMSLSRVTQLVNFPTLLAFMLVVWGMVARRHRISRRQGAALLGGYAAYLALLASLAHVCRT